MKNKGLASSGAFVYYGGPGGTRTHMPFGRNILSVVRIPIPPLDQGYLFFSYDVAQNCP